MPYSAEISRANPTCFLFLIDQSGSMADPVPGLQKRKADSLADILNRMLQNLVIRCSKDEGIRDYFHVGVIGYGRQVGPAFVGPLAGKELAPVSEIANFPARLEERTKKVDDGAGGLVEQKVKFPIWIDPQSDNGTPMCSALAQAKTIIQGWLSQYPACFPPVVIHITDGESTDGDPGEAMNAISALGSSDGNCLLFNLHLSSNPQAQPIVFPDSSTALPDQYAKLLFDRASPLTANMRAEARARYSLDASEGARGFVLNADMEAIIMALDIGTRPSNLR